jgi:tetratricopeptide (TPR) repeat protein
MKRILIAMCMLTLSEAGWSQVDSSSFMVGNVLYEQGNYRDAINVYEKVIKENGYSAEVNYNLGNCYYKTGEIGKCILNYERALALDPNDSDIKYNLDLANMRIRDDIAVVDELILSIWWRNILQLFTVNTWATLSIIFIWLGLAGLIAFRFSNVLKVRRAGFYLFISGLFLSVLICIITVSSNRYNRTHQFAVVMTPSAILKSEPNESSTNLSLIHEGLKIQLLETQGNWVEIKLPDGNVGWLIAEAVEKI